MPAMEMLRKLPPQGVPPEKIEELAEMYDESALRVLAQCPPIVGQVFPNMGVMSGYILSAEQNVGPMITIRTWNPHGPEELEVLSWSLVERSAQENLRGHTRKTTIQTFGSSGIIEQDDAEAWPSLTRASKGTFGKQQWLRYQARHEAKTPEGWPDKGLLYSGISKDDNQWNWWTSYYEFLTNTAW
jgi:hypothetical protein